ncbi:uncharacterized protein NEMAJ01_1058 [Nematocida major]|uniref:uncharacterized protein n=1 Tax=Nematocida major TaxID=1912982 RepID=UPI002008AD10|nr:uncharacterized protein NEMAJ01_1058 [Nematocida major]KAH9386162.1 hypothetical protein NEMAJ01_1058 [Nematocida major]
MGVKGLWKMISGRTLEMKELHGLSLCIDANLVLFPGICSGNIVFITEYMLKSIQTLIVLGIDPIFVFDGRKPLFKSRPPKKTDARRAKTKPCEIPKPPTASAREGAASEFGAQEDLKAVELPGYSPEITDQDFSMYQIQRVSERHKYFKTLTKRMHGESDLIFKLSSHGAPAFPKEEPKEPCEFESTLLHLEKMRSHVHIGLEACRKAEEKKPAPPLKRARGLPSCEITPSEEVSEYRRELQTYSLPTEDTLLSSEPVDKESLPFSYRIIVGILDAFCVKYVIAPSESDSIYRSIERIIHTDGVITEDSDMLLFSSKPVFRHIFKKVALPKVFSESSTPLGYSRAELHILAWLLGNDYVPGICNIGPSKAKLVIEKYRAVLETRPACAESSSIINVSALSEVVEKIPEIDMVHDIHALMQVQRVYEEKQFKVRIENRTPAPIDKRKILDFLTQRTTWASAEKEGYFKMVQEYHSRISNSKHAPPT